MHLVSRTQSRIRNQSMDSNTWEWGESERRGVCSRSIWLNCVGIFCLWVELCGRTADIQRGLVLGQKAKTCRRKRWWRWSGGLLRSTWPHLLTFLCAAERASPWVLGVSATASFSDPPQSPPGAARARSGCQWWSGCTGSWRAPSGRPRRTKRPRDWCSSGRWDAGPSDSLWSQSGEEEVR